MCTSIDDVPVDSALMKDYEEGRRFWLGPVSRVLFPTPDIQLLEYKEKELNKPTLTGVLLYKVFVNFKDQHISTRSIEEGILVGLCCKYEPDDHHHCASRYFQRMIGMPDEYATLDK